MKRILIVCLCLIGCASNAQSVGKPTGEQVLASLLAVSAMPLSKEPMCNITSVSMNKPDLQLKDHLATVLSSSFESKNITTVSTACDISKHELDEGNIIDIWDCTLLINETSSDEEFISSSTIVFSLSKKTLAFIQKSLRCF